MSMTRFISRISFISLTTLLLSFHIAGSPAAGEQHEQHATAVSVGLVKEAREATKGFLDVNQALTAGYAAFLGCVSGPEEGAMGIHFVNAKLIEDAHLDPARPEALLYEPKDGRLQLVAAEYVVLADAWNAANKTPPTLLGQAFHYTASPNRYGLPAFYALHVWMSRPNPNGAFADWNPRVRCDAYAPEGASR